MALRHLAKEVCGKLGTSFAYAGPERLAFVPTLLTRSYAQVPENLKYTKSHEWVKVDGDTATLGVSDFAQMQLGDVVYVELPEVGTQLKKDEAFGVVESVKTASDVYMPVDGEIVAANGAVSGNTELVNTDCYGEGWLIKVKMSEPSQADALWKAEQYSAHIADA